MRVLGSGRGRTGRLAVKHRPADFVSQPLVIQHKIANRIRQLTALPLTFLPTGALTPAVWRSRAYRLDCVGRRAEFVGGDMSYRHGLPCSIRRMPRSTGQIPSSGVRSAGRCARLRHRDLAPHPSTCLLDRLARSRISRLHLLKQMQNVLRAVSCPHGEKPVIRVLQRAATANRDESGVAIFGKDHNAPSCERVQGKLSRTFKYSSIAFIYFNLSGQRPTPGVSCLGAGREPTPRPEPTSGCRYPSFTGSLPPSQPSPRCWAACNSTATHSPDLQPMHRSSPPSATRTPAMTRSRCPCSLRFSPVAPGSPAGCWFSARRRAASAIFSGKVPSKAKGIGLTAAQRFGSAAAAGLARRLIN